MHTCHCIITTFELWVNKWKYADFSIKVTTWVTETRPEKKFEMRLQGGDCESIKAGALADSAASSKTRAKSEQN